MSNPYFRFKQFTVFHDQCAMKVGVDGVTLGAWADVAGAKLALDVGCGSGLIALMLAQRCDTEITAIDIDEGSIRQAELNFKNAPWIERMSVLHTSLQDFAEKNSTSFDLIVSNPPFFINSLKNPSQARTTARHTDTLSHSDLILGVKKLLAESGKFCVVLPVSEGELFVDLAEKEGLFCSRRTTVFPNEVKPAKRLLLEFRKMKGVCAEASLTIEKERNIYTPEYAEMVREFYLKL